MKAARTGTRCIDTLSDLLKINQHQMVRWTIHQSQDVIDICTVPTHICISHFVIAVSLCFHPYEKQKTQSSIYISSSMYCTVLPCCTPFSFLHGWMRICKLPKFCECTGSNARASKVTHSQPTQCNLNLQYK